MEVLDDQNGHDTNGQIGNIMAWVWKQSTVYANYNLKTSLNVCF